MVGNAFTGILYVYLGKALCSAVCDVRCAYRELARSSYRGIEHAAELI